MQFHVASPVGGMTGSFERLHDVVNSRDEIVRARRLIVRRGHDDKRCMRGATGRATRGVKRRDPEPLPSLTADLDFAQLRLVEESRQRPQVKIRGAAAPSRVGYPQGSARGKATRSRPNGLHRRSPRHLGERRVERGKQPGKRKIPWGQAARACSVRSALRTWKSPGFQVWNFALRVPSSTRVRVCSIRCAPRLDGKWKISWGQLPLTPPVERANTVLKRPLAVQNEDGPTT